MRFLSVLFLATLLLVGTILVDAKKHTATAVRRREEHTNSIEKRHKYHGRATWFVPSIHGGSMGACWEYEGDHEYVVAMNKVQYGSLTNKSGWCFKKIRIYANGKSVDAVVKDACPECKYGDLDLTPPVFKALGDLDTGILKITWHEI